MAEIETMVEPDSIADDIGWESVPFINIHPPILTIWAAYLAVPTKVLTHYRAQIEYFDPLSGSLALSFETAND